jgi:hypothetical protein
MSSLSASHAETVVHVVRSATEPHVVMTAEATVAHAATTEVLRVHAVTVVRSRLLQSRTTSQRCSKHF